MKCPHAFFINPAGDRVYYTPVNTVQGSLYQEGILVPCGKCLICRANRAAEWASRLTHELQYSSTGTFVTLTYDDLSVPYSQYGLSTLYKKDLQLFWKRFRKSLGKNTKIKYYACGEYGSITRRPHYHAIIFGWSPDPLDLIPLKNGYYSSRLLTDLWPLGYNQVGSITTESIHYVSGYLLKKLWDERIQLRLKKPEFLSTSQKLGLPYVENNKQKLYSGEFSAEGTIGPVPRYYRKKLKEMYGAEYADYFRDMAIGKASQISNHYAVLRKLYHQKNLNPSDSEDYLLLKSMIESARKQNEKELLTKLKRSRKPLD